MSPLTENQAELYRVFKDRFGHRLFDVDHALQVTARKDRPSMIGSINVLINKGVLSRYRTGVYAVSPGFNPERGPEPEPELKPAPAIKVSALSFLRSVGFDIKRKGRIFIMNGRMPLTEEVLMKIANMRRAKMGMPALSEAEAV